MEPWLVQRQCLQPIPAPVSILLLPSLYSKFPKKPNPTNPTLGAVELSLPKMQADK